MSSGLMLNTPKKGEVFRHQNGVKYRIEGLARVDNDYQELLVVATGPDGIMWARPIGNFMGLRQGKPRFEKVDEVMDHPGVTFQSNPSLAEFEPGSAQAVTDSLGIIKAANGSWTLHKDGKLTLTAEREAHADSAAPYAIIEGVVYLSRADLEKSWLNLADLQVSKTCSVKMGVTSTGQQYAAGVFTEAETHWNKPEDLPPVGCELLIKVPAGTNVVTVKSETMEMGHTTDAERVFKVFRTSHLADRAGAMDYRLPDNCIVTGRFPWTYP